MKTKILMIAACLAVVGMSAFAGFDQYNSKNYTSLLTPHYLADSTAVVSNSVNSGVDIMGLPGNGCIVFEYKCDNAAGAIIAFQIATCATTNGTYTVYTNSAGVSSWSYTNSAGHGKVLFKPNTASRYLRVYATPTLVTNGVAGAVLVTE